jgi:hypothetical protein
MARPTKLTPELTKKAWKYIEQAKDTVEVLGDNKPVVINNVNLPTIEGLASYLGTHRDTLYEWEKESIEFSDILTHVRNNQAERLINKGLSGSYNPVIAKLLLSKHGYIEKQQQDLNHSGDVTFINDLPRPNKNE